MKILLLSCLFYFSCVSSKPGTNNVIDVQLSNTDNPKMVELYRTDYPDTLVVSREFANRLIEESGGIWTDTLDQRITIYRTDYPDTLVVSRELANRLVGESGGIWQRMKQ